jgi:hypothetical protein
MSKKTRLPRSALKYQSKSERLARAYPQLVVVSPDVEALAPAFEQAVKDIDNLAAVYMGSYAGAMLNLQDNIAKTFAELGKAMANGIDFSGAVWGVDMDATAEPPPGVSRTTDVPKRNRFECLEV